MTLRYRAYADTPSTRQIQYKSGTESDPQMTDAAYAQAMADQLAETLNVTRRSDTDDWVGHIEPEHKNPPSSGPNGNT